MNDDGTVVRHKCYECMNLPDYILQLQYLTTHVSQRKVKRAFDVAHLAHIVAGGAHDNPQRERCKLVW